MLDRIHLSGDAAAGIIWLIIFVLWGIGKLLTAIRKQKIAKEYDASAGPPPSQGVEDQLRKFIETLTGQELEEMLPTPVPQPPLRAPPPRPTSAPARAPARAPLRPAPSSLPFGMEPAARWRNEVEPAVEVPPEIVVQFLSQGAALPGHEYMLGLRNSITLPPDASLLLPTPNKHSAARHFYKIESREALQRAFLDRVVLGPPRGLSSGMPYEELTRP